MGYYNENMVDDTIFEFPKVGFWAIHILGGMLLFWLGMRFAFFRLPIPIVLYRITKMFR